MRKSIEIPVTNVKQFTKKLTVFASTLSTSCILNSNDFPSAIPGCSTNKSIEFIAALDSVSYISVSSEQKPFEKLYTFWKKNHDWLFGHLSYDLKNSIEKLSSNHPDYIGFPELFFFQPQFIIEIQNKKAIIWYTDKDNEETVSALIKKIEDISETENEEEPVNIQSRFTKQEYIDTIEKIKQHIQCGDIYEMNFCQEFYANNVNLDPALLYNKLCELSPAPFSCFYKTENRFLISASPERFLKKQSHHIISQPMKGTSVKGANKKENDVLKKQLFENHKERAENIMIVDLVRNDLSRTALPETIRVDELCGIYEFPQVLQMISTVSSQISENTKFTDTILHAFPMGSMTGAPKIRAMEIIEQFEKTKRGLYSGSVGYINPDGDFDFNVVIRSIQYNADSGYISFQTGGAITINSDPQMEYEECLIKAQGINMTLHKKLKVNA